MVSKKSASAKKAAPAVAKKPTTKVTTVKAASTETPAHHTVKSSRAPEESSTNLLRSFAAEFIGTFILACVVMAIKGEALYVGFALVAIVLMIGTLSGSHVNPLVTIGAWATRKITGQRAVIYLIAQVLGAMLALTVLTAYSQAAPKVDPQAAMFGQAQVATLFKAAPLPEGKAWFIFFSEMIGAAIFGFAVSGAMREVRNRAAQAFAVGLGLSASLIVAGSAALFVSGSAVVNPAIAITVHAIEIPGNAAAWWALLVYVVGPIIGGTLGFFLYDVLRGERTVGHTRTSDEF
jgi:aquaporin Z